MNDELAQAWGELMRNFREFEKKHPPVYMEHCNTCKCKKGKDNV
jgi:hypothetical protein